MKEEKNQLPCIIYILNRDDPVRLKMHFESLVGLLITFLDIQGVDLELKYKIYKGRSKNPLTLSKIKNIVLPYILSWYPETGEKELTCREQEQTMKFKGVYKLLDTIQIQCQDPSHFIEGIRYGIKVGDIIINSDLNEIFQIDGEYQPNYKLFPISRKRKENIRRYTIRPGKRKRSILTPKQVINREKIDEPFQKIHMIEKEGKNIIIQETEKIKRVPKRKKKILIKKTTNTFLLTPNYNKE